MAADLLFKYVNLLDEPVRSCNAPQFRTISGIRDSPRNESYAFSFLHLWSTTVANSRMPASPDSDANQLSEA